MHFITSNFNLIETNSAWSKLKKNDVKIDTDFDNFFLNLSKKNGATIYFVSYINFFN